MGPPPLKNVVVLEVRYGGDVGRFHAKRAARHPFLDACFNTHRMIHDARLWCTAFVSSLSKYEVAPLTCWPF